jgi:hypothetical protein
MPVLTVKKESLSVRLFVKKECVKKRKRDIHVVLLYTCGKQGEKEMDKKVYEKWQRKVIKRNINYSKYLQKLFPFQ